MKKKKDVQNADKILVNLDKDWMNNWDKLWTLSLIHI